MPVGSTTLLSPSTAELGSPPALQLAGTALFLDLDGTLAPLAERPEDVAPEPRRTRLIDGLTAGLDGRLAVVSGRTLADIDRILERRVPCVAAVHGLVRRGCDGEVTEAPPHPALAHAVCAFRGVARRDPGLIVEEKGASVALHFRLAPGCAAEARLAARRLAEDTGLVLQEGDMVAELRTPGPTKGDSIRAFMADPLFAGARPVFAGDDLTDEHGFDAARDLGGYGVLVGASRPTAAAFRLDGVAALMAWLEAAR
jgi:trehalose 6-phosphate phosphatase